MKMRALSPFIEDDEAFLRDAVDAAGRQKLIAALLRRRTWMFWCALAATALLVASLSVSLAMGRSFLAGPLLGFVYFWMKFSACSTTLRMLRLFAELMVRTSSDR